MSHREDLDPKPWVLRKPGEPYKVSELFTFEVIGLLEAHPELIDHIEWSPEASFLGDHREYPYIQNYESPRAFLLQSLKGLAERSELYKDWGILEESCEDDLEVETATQYNPFTISIENMTVTIYNRGSQE